MTWKLFFGIVYTVLAVTGATFAAASLVWIWGDALIAQHIAQSAAVFFVPALGAFLIGGMLYIESDGWD